MTTTNKTKLSKGILDMKFMKKTKEKVEKQLFQEEGKEYFGNQRITDMKQEIFIIEPSYVFCKELIDGRVSFHGMNPEIEKLMEMEESIKCTLVKKEKETDISDKQMVEHLTLSKAFMMRKVRDKKGSRKLLQNASNKGEPVRKRQKFRKPIH